MAAATKARQNLEMCWVWRVPSPPFLLILTSGKKMIRRVINDLQIYFSKK